MNFSFSSAYYSKNNKHTNKSINSNNLEAILVIYRQGVSGIRSDVFGLLHEHFMNRFKE